MFSGFTGSRNFDAGLNSLNREDRARDCSHAGSSENTTFSGHPHAGTDEDPNQRTHYIINIKEEGKKVTIRKFSDTNCTTFFDAIKKILMEQLQYAMNSNLQAGPRQRT
jgi:hypothetical protein